MSLMADAFSDIVKQRKVKRWKRMQESVVLSVEAVKEIFRSLFKDND